MANWILLAQLPALILGVWLFTIYMTRNLPLPQGKRICLLIAHPDDEAMFFAPAVLALTQPHLQNRVFILCLSSGNADGLGAIRKKELVKSAAILGVGSSRSSASRSAFPDQDESREEAQKHVVVLDDERFPDSMIKTWDAGQISSVLAHYFAPSLLSSSFSSSSPSSTSSSSSSARARVHGTTNSDIKIDVLITFDRLGVSRHPNHISLYHGARAFLQSLVSEKARGHASSSSSARDIGRNDLPEMYTLTSVNAVRKYSGVFDALTTLISLTLPLRKAQATDDTTDHVANNRKKTFDDTKMKKRSGADEDGFAPGMFVISTPGQVRAAQRAMTDAHVSQMRWFRWGWIAISRYMYVNDLSRELVS